MESTAATRLISVFQTTSKKNLHPRKGKLTIALVPKAGTDLANGARKNGRRAILARNTVKQRTKKEQRMSQQIIRLLASWTSSWKIPTSRNRSWASVRYPSKTGRTRVSRSTLLPCQEDELAKALRAQITPLEGKVILGERNATVPRVVRSSPLEVRPIIEMYRL